MPLDFRRSYLVTVVAAFLVIVTLTIAATVLAQTTGEEFGKAHGVLAQVVISAPAQAERPLVPRADGIGHVRLGHSQTKRQVAGPLDPPLFLQAVTYDSGGSGWGSSSVVIADVNKDGKPDLVVANCFSDNVAVLLGNGDGTFQPAVTYVTGGGVDPSVAVADVTGDGEPDIVLGLDGSIAVLLGNGDGTFQPAVTYGTDSILANSIAIADLNRDGKPDVVVEGVVHGGGIDRNDAVAVLLGNGDGTFRPAVEYDPGGGEYVNQEIELGARSLAIADVNSDGKPDLLVANSLACPSGCLYGSVGVLLGSGDGTFQSVVTYHSGGEYANSVAVADVNGDGKPDVAVANLNNTVGVLLGKGDGTLQSVATYSGGAVQIAIADVNGDGKLDLLDTGVGVRLGNGDGTFQTAVHYDSGSSETVSIAVADLAGRGLPDLVVSSAPGTLGVLLHAGTTPTTTTMVSSPNPTVFGQTVTLTASVSSGAGTPNGVVVFYDGSKALGSAGLVNGVATLPVSSLGAGSHAIGAVYQGSLKFNSSVSDLLTQVVNVATTTTSLASSRNPAAPGQKVTYTATVTGQYGGAATGTVTFRDGNSMIATVTLANNRAAYAIKYPSTGTHSITATSPGDANNTASTSPALTEHILYSTSTSLTTSGSPTFAGQAVTFTAMVTSAQGTVSDGELVTFFDGATAIGTGPTASGVAKFSTSSLASKTHTIRATYAGDVNFRSSTGTVGQVVNKYPTTTTLNSSPNPSQFGQAVTFTATVTPSGPNAPTGKVRFFDGTVEFGLATLNGGVAKLIKSTLAVGAHPITAQYLADSINDKSTSSVLDQVVQ